MFRTLPRLLVTTAVILVAAPPLAAQGVTRARTLGIHLPGTPGTYNAITDVRGVEVGVSTIIHGDGPVVRGEGPARTGVTTIFPRGKAGPDHVFAGWFTLNGNGEMTGTVWLKESGILESPIAITNTHSVGVVRDAIIGWQGDRSDPPVFMLPLVAETFDGVLNDDLGFHVETEHVVAALDGASGGPVPEGNVGGGTGMICHGFKGGTGTSSRQIEVADETYTVGVLVQCNYGQRRLLRVDGVPVGEEISEDRLCREGSAPPTRPWLRGVPRCGAEDVEPDPELRKLEGMGSIIVIVATDAPLMPNQLERVAKRASLGIGRMGGLGENSSGDIFMAFSTANREGVLESGVASIDRLPNGWLNPVFEATVQATEEAILNALLAAETMVGADGMRVTELPHDRLVEVLRRHGRAVEPSPEAREIRNRREAFNRSIADHDADAIAGFLLPEYHLISGRSGQWHGVEANHELWSGNFREDSTVVYVRTPATVQVNREWGLAEELGSWRGSYAVQGRSARASGSYAAKWQRDESGTWRLQSEVFTTLSCEGPPAACRRPDPIPGG